MSKQLITVAPTPTACPLMITRAHRRVTSTCSSWTTRRTSMTLALWVGVEFWCPCVQRPWRRALCGGGAAAAARGAASPIPPSPARDAARQCHALRAPSLVAAIVSEVRRPCGRALLCGARHRLVHGDGRLSRSPLRSVLALSVGSVADAGCSLPNGELDLYSRDVPLFVVFL